MRTLGLRTLSARILLGFAVLILTFTVVIAVLAGNMYVLTGQIRVIPNGYLQLALIGKNLIGKQQTLRDYVTTEIGEEASSQRARARIRRLREYRRTLLVDSRDMISRLSSVPKSHRRYVRKSADFMDRIDADLLQLESKYVDLLRRPPLVRHIEHPEWGEGAARELEAARSAQREISKVESRVLALLNEFAHHQEDLVESTALGVARNERRVRMIAIVLGAAAIFVSLIIATWVTLTLRPLRRLRQAARRIARGDYASRIEERGPSEVAALAHEFNLMGRAIQEREREVVRNERLAAVGKMAAMITHEVRNPLASISLNTELLQEEVDAVGGESASEARELCHSIMTEVERLTGMTEEYLKYARLPKPRLVTEDVNAIVCALVEFEREGLRQQDIVIEVDLADPSPSVLADESQLRQALRNLLRNAAEALGEQGRGGTISIATVLDGDGAAAIEVGDDGPGIPQELADKLFDPFVSSKDRGTGLGLAMAHQIALEHDGLLTVDSAPGRGTRFRLELPAVSGKN